MATIGNHILMVHHQPLIHYDRKEVDMGGILAIVGGIAGALAALAIVPGAIKSMLGRIPPGAQAVIDKSGKYVLDEASQVRKIAQDGVDNARLFEGRMPFIPWPRGFLRVLYVTDQDSMLEEKVFDLVEPDPNNPGRLIRVQYQYGVQITWGVIRSYPRYTNYVARAARVSRNNDLILMGLVVKEGNGNLWNVIRLDGMNEARLANPDFVFKELEARCHEKLLEYGSEIRGASIMKLARTPIQVLVDGGKKFVPHMDESDDGLPGGMNGGTVPAAEAVGVDLGVHI